MIFLDLPTELLFHILSYLPAVDLCTAQLICHQINRIITDSAFFQYIICAHINGVEDLLPSDCSFHDRLELLQRHEKSRNILQFDKSADFPISIDGPSYDPDSYVLQDGYLIYKTDITRSYGYIDLCSSTGSKEASWVHVPMELSNIYFKLTFAVDQDLVISLSASQVPDGVLGSPLFMSTFEFTTGAPHPLSSIHAIPLPQVSPDIVPSIDIEVLGDYTLLSAAYPSRPSEVYLYLVSWKTGVVTHLRTYSDHSMLRPVYKLLVIDLDDNVVALPRSSLNSLEICKLEITSLAPRLNILCFLELPPLLSNVRCSITAAEKEWIPTSKHQIHSQSSRRRLVPFRSSTIRTVSFSLRYSTIPRTPVYYGMIVSVAALLSVSRSNCGNASAIPWARWGPAATHLRVNGSSFTLPYPAGPFWVLDKSPLVIRDYDVLGKWRVQPTVENASSLSRPSVLPSKTFGRHWVGGVVETYLPYRDVVAISDRHLLLDCARALIDREWLVGIWYREETNAGVIVHHIG